MKKLQIIQMAVLLALPLFLFSCKKDNSSDAVTGRWTGTWNHTGSSKQSMEVTFNAGNTGNVKYSTINVPCTWQKSGNKITFEYRENNTSSGHFLHGGTVSGNKMTGTWGIFPNESGRGDFELSKQ